MRKRELMIKRVLTIFLGKKLRTENVTGWPEVKRYDFSLWGFS